MAHPIERDEAIPKAIRRMARRELGKARDELADRKLPLADRIHDLRTAIKKVRAVAKMVRPHDRAAAKENRRLRKIARAVSPVREAEVMLHTFDTLAAAQPRQDGERRSLRRLRKQLSTRLRETEAGFQRKPGLAWFGKRLTRARRRTNRWAPRSDDWRAVGAGLVDSYRRAQQAMTEAYREMSGEAFHAWRRAAKAHRHQLYAMRELLPAELRPRLQTLDRLGDLLGEEHDLTIFQEALEQAGAKPDTVRASAGLLKEVDRRRNQLRVQAKGPGLELFGDDARQLASRLELAFRALHKVG